MTLDWQFSGSYKGRINLCQSQPQFRCGTQLKNKRTELMADNRPVNARRLRVALLQWMHA